MEATIFYSKGNCSIDSSANIRAVQIYYRGAIEIDNPNDGEVIIMEAKNKIMVVSFLTGKNLNDLFNYVGTLKISRAIACDDKALQANCTIKSSTDYSELMDSNSEDMDLHSEDMSSGYTHLKKVTRTKLKKPTIKNLKTTSHDGTLFLKTGEIYSGDFHVHLNSGKAMTGASHDGYSKELFYKKINLQRNLVDKLVSTEIKPTAKRKKHVGGTVSVGRTTSGGSY